MSEELPWLEVCGTTKGYNRHRYWGSVPCYACREAMTRYERDRRSAAPKPPRQLVPCGSASAYRRHIRRGEIACAECLAAHAADVARYQQPRREAS